MDAYYFTEMPYPHLPPLDEISSMRVNLPNRLFDPKVGGALYNRYLDEYCLADEVGLELMVNEHHSSVVCIDACAPLSLAILARQTKRGRLLILGNPVANRDDPVRIAEEMAMIDCISSGRLECGMVRGVTHEIFPGNTNPTMTNERLWEGVDLLKRAWTTHDGPFNYEGRFWHRRAVNIWPRPWQQPHPRIWITGSTDKENVKKVAEHGYVFATFLQPFDHVKHMFRVYRENYRSNGTPGGLAFMPLVYVAHNDEEAMAGADEIAWYMRSKAEPQFRNPPGFFDAAQALTSLRGNFAGRGAAMKSQGLEYLRERGVVIAGTPDSVYKQIKRYYDEVGGFDHFLMMMQAGFLDHKRTSENIKLFAKEVLPRIRELPPAMCAPERAEAAQ